MDVQCSDVCASTLHDRPDLLMAACELLNSEWARGLSARQHSIKRSSDELPCSLLLLAGADGGEKVVGFARLSRVLGAGDGMLVESVVVDKTLRGRGLGRAVMEAAERFAATHGFTTVYLSTHDKEAFYAHLGYRQCGPVALQPMSTQNMSESQMGSLTALFGIATQQPKPSEQVAPSTRTSASREAGDSAILPSCGTSGCAADDAESVPAPPPSGPPPPPPPPPPPTATSAKEPELPIVWMKKQLPVS
ncbi:N-alpha-acetyltransferase 80-like [Sycon ciliatum]|uniref:N-alpha-acetyltransferase 80-like n=1 Tax=Sycon ciliatum TaxID=27933 RepID=UPI0031F693AA